MRLRPTREEALAGVIVAAVVAFSLAVTWWADGVYHGWRWPE